LSAARALVGAVLGCWFAANAALTLDRFEAAASAEETAPALAIDAEFAKLELYAATLLDDPRLV
jgi:hypothetical protein